MAAGWRCPAAGSALTLLLSLGASGPALLRGGGGTGGTPETPLRAGEVHRLLTYIFSYDDLISLSCGAVLVWYFAGSFEKNVGTAKHCFLTVLFAVLSALLYLLLAAVVSRVVEVEDPRGFMPVAFAMLGVSTTRSRMRRALFLGVRVPVVLVPWFLLCVAWFIPRSSLLGNICGLLVGEAYGLGYCFCLDIPESVSSKLDRLFPFTLLKRVPGLRYIPGASAERRASESIKITPPPGSYPTQSSCSSSPPALPTFPPQHPAAQSPGFQHSCTPGHGLTGGHAGAQHSSATGHGLLSSLSQARGAFGDFYPQTHAGASPGQFCQPGKFSIPQHVCPPGLQAPVGPEPLAGVQQAPGHPAAPAPLVPAEFSRIQVY
uniref:Rhomboid domain containing 2 n=1 Tax=Anas platyrhynchos platyrhynchos TaxID=8840 RepID=A0A493TZJ1_ANAPP